MASSPPDRIRLDELLVARGLFASRSRAADAVRRGTVRVNGADAGKPGALVAADAAIAIDDPVRQYVSRAALKLIHALDHFSLDPAGRVCLDLGASTGGFTQVLLGRGAARVYAVDVGHGQLHPDVASDARVVSLEKLNARDLAPDLIGEPVQAIVADVSFIGLRLALPPALGLAAPGAWLVALVKPQFEVGRAALGKGGIVRDERQARAAADALSHWLEELRWQPLGITASPIAGGDGNREFLLAARRRAQ